ncbi:hypothetical protein [Spirosoma agri]|uniref:Uncharacterized protein n=1 Tax=Spirosoma agri TaxID=1987381 RepID=A0A6M0IJG3_9BACT|nr:hypothetical protein [Spirosoma agri]NEU67972.1 hypothetical protein [Spirosoma agri]
MWWKRTKTYSKQILKDANLDPVPYAKDRLRSEFAKTLLEPLPVEQTNLDNSVEFTTEAILLSIPQWQEIKQQLTSLSASGDTEQQAVIDQIIATIESR